MVYNMKQYRKILTVFLLLFATLLFACIERWLVGQLSTQQLVSRWSDEDAYAQISCFFPEKAAITADQVIFIEHEMKTALEEASVSESDANGRILVDAYSTQSELTVASDRTSATVRAYGVSNDFFLFHPLKLLSGSYFVQDDLNEDGVILDENVAWQLFGSNYVTGMTVEIGNRVYPVRGVVRSDSGFFSEAAEEGEATIYVPFSVLQEQTGEESALTIDCYEVLIANPVNGFGTSTVSKALGMEEDSYEMVENSARFDLKNRLLMIKDFAIRSMNTKGIIYPYWENRARAYENISMLLLVFEILCLCYPVWVFAGVIHHGFKKKEQIAGKVKNAVIAFAKKMPAYWRRFRKIIKRG